MTPEVREALERAMKALRSDIGDIEAYEVTLAELNNILNLDVTDTIKTIVSTVKSSIEAKLRDEDELAGNTLHIARVMTNEALEGIGGTDG